MKIRKLGKLVWKVVRWFLGATIVAFISLILGSAFSGINTWKLFKDAVSIVATFLVSPHSIMFLLLAVVLFWASVLHRRIGRLLGRDIKEVLAYNKQLVEVNNKLRKDINLLVTAIEKLKTENQELKEKAEQKEPELSAEHMLILKELANEPELVLEQGLCNLYFTYYPDKEMKDFKFVINDLINYELMRFSGSGPEGKRYSIEGKGLDALRKLISKV